MKDQTCSCMYCELSRKVTAAREAGDITAMEKIIDDLMGHLECTETDLCYYKAILDGSWPQSKEILERALEKVKAKDA